MTFTGGQAQIGQTSRDRRGGRRSCPQGSSHGLQLPTGELARPSGSRRSCPRGSSRCCWGADAAARWELVPPRMKAPLARGRGRATNRQQPGCGVCALAVHLAAAAPRSRSNSSQLRSRTTAADHACSGGCPPLRAGPRHQRDGGSSRREGGTPRGGARKRARVAADGNTERREERARVDGEKKETNRYVTLKATADKSSVRTSKKSSVRLWEMN